MTALENLHPNEQREVREQVRGLLGKSEAFAALPDGERRELARKLVDVVAYLADPTAGQELATAMADQKEEKTAAQKTGDRLSEKSNIVQDEFTAAAGREGAEIYEDMANAVDFPQFVADLIDGVFNSIVSASIKQMEAYGELLAQVVKSVDEFAKDNFTANQGRDWLAGRFPTQLSIETGGATPRLVPTEAGEENGLMEVRQGLGMGADDELDLEDEASEAELARRGQLEMAKLRQKQLATMVLMGINRIVVTDGLINAKVIIDVKTSDKAQRRTSASMFDEQDTRRVHGNSGDWFSSSYDHTNSRHKTTVSSAVDDTSESRADVKAKLTGEVRVNFKSETFPLDKLASQTQLDSVNERAGQ